MKNIDLINEKIADVLSNKKLYPIVTELFIRGRKLNFSLVFNTQSHISCATKILDNSTYHFIIKIPNKQELQQIAFNHLSDIEFKDLMNSYKQFIAKPYSFWVIGCPLVLDNPLHVRKNLLERI